MAASDAVAGVREGDGVGAPAARVVVRPVGSPLPLGFLALVVATVGFAALQLEWVPASQGSAVALAVLVLTVPLQLVACVLGLLARDVVAGTGMGMLAGTWGATALVTLAGPPGASSGGLGVVLCASGVTMLVPAVAATTKPVAATVMGLTAVRYAVTGVAELTADRAWFTAAGAVGLVLAAVALYAALAFARGRAPAHRPPAGPPRSGRGRARGHARRRAGRRRARGGGAPAALRVQTAATGVTSSSDSSVSTRPRISSRMRRTGSMP